MQDITKINIKKIPKHEILCAGFPCQPFSRAGISSRKFLKRAHGLDDKDQGDLFFNILDILKAKRPKAFILENVQNLKTYQNDKNSQACPKHLPKARQKHARKINIFKLVLVVVAAI